MKTLKETAAWRSVEEGGAGLGAKAGGKAAAKLAEDVVNLFLDLVPLDAGEAQRIGGGDAAVYRSLAAKYCGPRKIKAPPRPAAGVESAQLEGSPDFRRSRFSTRG